MNVLQIKDNLVCEISKCNNVMGIAQTGDINAKSCFNIIFPW